MFYHVNEKVVYQTTNFNLQEFKEFLLREKPELLYNYQYSDTQPLYQLSNIDDEGLDVIGLALADKSSRRKTWAAFYRSLEIEGIGNLYICPNTTPKPQIIYTEQEKIDAAEARLLLEQAIMKLPKKYLSRLSSVLSDIGQDVFKCEPYGDPVYDAWKSAKNDFIN